jgi:hypothetical protein
MPAMENIDSTKLCGTGLELQAELERQDKAITSIQTQMADLHRRDPDSLNRQVPRSLRENLQSAMNQRALTRLQWDRHRINCQFCQTALVAVAPPASAYSPAAPRYQDTNPRDKTPEASSSSSLWWSNDRGRVA